MKNIILWIIALTALSCWPSREGKIFSEKPNILWIVAEDLGPYIPSFGDSTIVTENLSRLAREGICFDNVFSPSPVCAPSRAAIATGMYPTRIGANHMRTGPWYSAFVPDSIVMRYSRYMPEGIKPYEAILPEGTKMMSEYLREAGYYCTNNAKEDYQFRRSLMAWDDSSQNGHWRNRPEGQPFFSIFNLGITHESQIWARAQDSLWVSEDLDVPIPPYLPATDSVIMDIRRMYSNIKIMDQQVGQLLNQLEEDGLLEKTVIFWYTDHGGPLPRQKRLLYDSGLKVPMIIRFPEEMNAGQRDDRMISFIDFAPTALSLAGIQAPDLLDGKAFLGPHKRNNEPDYIFAAADRFDETYDQNRAVRDKRYKLIRYLQPEKPMFLHVNYRDQMPTMRELYRLRNNNNLTPEQALWFRQNKPAAELFDTWKDPHEVNNLSGSEELNEVESRLASALDTWMNTVTDLNIMPEKELIDQLWPEGKQPNTIDPYLVEENGRLILKCETPGASIGYRTVHDESDFWRPYTKPITADKIEQITAIAHRVGYTPSNQVVFDVGSDK